MTKAQADAHQLRHGFVELASAVAIVKERKLRRSQMNKSEHEYSLILESKKRRGEINDYKFEGITLRWGEDPETGRAMRFTPDFTVWKDGGAEIEFHEVKGFIRSRDLVRFKGARAEWSRYHFELWQKREGQWARIY